MLKGIRMFRVPSFKFQAVRQRHRKLQVNRFSFARKMKGNRNRIRNVSAAGAAVSFPFNWNLEL
jgi:hypothetical protein